MIKKFLFMFLIFAMLIILSPVRALASYVGTSFDHAIWQGLVGVSIDTIWNDTTKDLQYKNDNGFYDKNCKMFVNYVVDKVFNEHSFPSYYKYTYEGINYADHRRLSRGIVISQFLNDDGARPTAEIIKELFNKANIGDVVQMRWLSDLRPHTAIISDMDENRVYFLEANAPAGTIANHDYEWSTLAANYCAAGDFGGFTIYHVGAQINKTNFPDDIFRDIVLSNLDTNNDGILSALEGTAATVYVPYCGISNLEGINFFTHLQSLTCDGNNLIELDVSKNSILQVLRCDDNQISELDLTKNVNLFNLYCENNGLSSLSLGQHPNFIWLYCAGNNLSEINITGCPNLEAVAIHCDDGVNIIGLEYVKPSVAINEDNFPDETFRLKISNDCDTDRDGMLSREEAVAITHLDMYGDYISGYSSFLDKYIEKIASLEGIEFFTNLVRLSCPNNALTALNLGMNTALEWLDCSGNNLTSLILNPNNSGQKNINVQDDRDSPYTGNNRSRYMFLENLICYNNNLTTLDLSACPFLDEDNVFCDEGVVIYWGEAGALPDGGVPINKTNFPEIKFRRKLFENYDINRDGILSKEEISNIQTFTAEYYHTLKGVEFLTDLVELNVWNGGSGNYNDADSVRIKELDVSKNFALEVLYCSNQELTKLDVSKNTALRVLDCSNNKLMELDLSNNTELEVLFCDNNQLTELDLNNNKVLEVLYCHDNNLSSLLIDTSADVFQLYCQNNPELRYVDLSRCPTRNVYKYLEWWVKCDATTVIILDPEVAKWYNPALLPEGIAINDENFPDDNFRHYVAHNFDSPWERYTDGILTSAEIEVVTDISVWSCDIENLKGIEYFTNLQHLECGKNRLTELDLSCNTKLEYLGCDFNQLKNLNVSKNHSLKTLACRENQLEKIDLSNNPELEELDCWRNNLRELNLTNNPKLKYLGCEYNQLEKLDVSANIVLEILNCHNNKLNTLILGNKPLLRNLACMNNQLTVLDLSKCPPMKRNENLYYDDGVEIISGNPTPALTSEDIDERKPKIAKVDLPIALTGKEYRIELSAQSSSDITWSAKKLPDGLTIDSSTGVISGVPTKAKTSNFTVTAENEAGKSSETFTISVYELPSITTVSVKEGTVNKTYSSKFKANGSKPITWSAKGLPNGLSINPDNGTISGATSAFGVFPLTITAENPVGSDELNVNLIIHAIPPKISGKFDAGFLSEYYSSTITLSKGTEPIEWTLEGALPEGLSFDTRTATLSGTPAQTWNGSVTITASNDAGVAQKSMSLKIKGTSPKVSGKFEKGNLNEPYSSALMLSKGTLPVNFSFEGTLPNGLNFNPETLTLSGTPSELWNDYITVTVTNGAGSYSKAFKIQIKGTAPKIVTSGLPVGNVNSSYSFELEATGSNPITWTAENLPEGLNLNGNRIEGTPSEECRNLKITVRASNPIKTVSKTFRLTVNEAVVVEETSSPAPEEKFENNSEEISDKSEEIKPDENISEGKIIFGTERDVSSVNLTVISEDYEIAAVLPEIHVTESGMYEIEVEISEDISAGKELIWLACAKNSEPSDDDKIAEFYDEEGNEITEVPENHKITVSAWFNEGVIYEPVVAVK